MKVVLISSVFIVGVLVAFFNFQKGAQDQKEGLDGDNSNRRVSNESRGQPEPKAPSNLESEAQELRSSLETIYKTLGAGQKRELAIQRAFANSRGSLLESLEVYRSLKDSGEQKSANLGIAFRLAREGDLSLVYDLLENDPQLTTKEASIFANGLGLMVDPLSVNRFRGMKDYLTPDEVVRVPLSNIYDALSKLTAIEPNGSAKDRRVRGLLEHAHRQRPFEAFNLFQSTLNDGPGDYGDLQHIFKSTVGFMWGCPWDR